MKLISCPTTTFHKRVLPVLCAAVFALLGAVTVAAYLVQRDIRAAAIGGVSSLGVTAVVFVALWLRRYDVADEIWEDGDVLIVRSGSREVHIPMTNVIGLEYTRFQNPTRMTLTLREPCEFGSEIIFLPLRHKDHVSMPEEIAFLKARIDGGRRNVVK